MSGMPATGAGAPITAARPQARLLRPVDDVATALSDLRGGSTVVAASGPVVREVTLQEDIRAGHKFAVRALTAGLRIRKYGEFIGRTTVAVTASLVSTGTSWSTLPLTRNRTFPMFSPCLTGAIKGPT